MKNHNIIMLLLGFILITLEVIFEMLWAPTMGIGSFYYNLIVIVSKIISAIGISFVVGFFTSKFQKSDEYNKYMTEKLSEVYEEKISPLVINSLDSFISNPKSLEHMDDKFKYELAKNLLYSPSTEWSYSKLNNYRDKVISDLLNVRDSLRENVIIIAKAFSKDDVVHLEVVVDYLVFRLGDSFPAERTFTDSGETSKLVYLKISNPENSNQSFIFHENDLRKMQTTAHGTSLEYIREINIPQELMHLTSIKVEKKVIFDGNGHWINFEWFNATPTKGVAITLNCVDNLVVKEYAIYDATNIFSVVGNNDEIGFDDTLNISTPQWVNPNSGFCITIGNANSEEDKSHHYTASCHKQNSETSDTTSESQSDLT